MSTTKCQIPTTFGEEVFSALENFDRRIYFRWDLRTDKLELKQPVANHSYDIGTSLLDASTKLWHSGLIPPMTFTFSAISYIKYITAVRAIGAAPATRPAKSGFAVIKKQTTSGPKSISLPISMTISR